VILCAAALDAEPLVASERRAATALAAVWRPAFEALARRLGAEMRIAVSRRARELHDLPGVVIVADLAGDPIALAREAAAADQVVRVTDLCPDPVVTLAGELEHQGARIVPAGTLIEDLIFAHRPAPIAWVALDGGPLSGVPLDRDARTGPGTRALYVAAAGAEIVRQARARADRRPRVLTPSGLGGDPAPLPLELVTLRLGLRPGDPPWLSAAP
jgi:hypothetical protein